MHGATIKTTIKISESKRGRRRNNQQMTQV